MNKLEKTACKYAWSYPIIDLGRAELRNCCRVPFNKISEQDWEMGIDIFKNLDSIKQVKRDLIRGIKTEKCRTCWTSEEYKIHSPRGGLSSFISFLKESIWQNLTDEEIKEKLNNLSEEDMEKLENLEHPEHIEISLSTTCDLKCVYCSEVFSTQWATEKLKYNEITIDEIPKNNDDRYEKIWWEWFEKVASKTVKNITFVGGEPLINDKFYEYVDKLIEFYDNTKKSRLHIFVATNLNTPKKFFDKLLSLIDRIVKSKYISIAIGLSFESVGEKNNIIRSNSNWEVFSNNISVLMTTIKTLDLRKWRVNIVLMPAINTLSVSSLPDYLKFIINMRDNFDRNIRLSKTHVTYPMRYSPFILTGDFIKYLDEGANILKNSKWYEEIPKNDHGSWIAFTEYLESLKNSILRDTTNEIIHARKDFANDIKKLSIRRNFVFENVFPELIDFYNLCSKV